MSVATGNSSCRGRLFAAVVGCHNKTNRVFVYTHHCIQLRYPLGSCGFSGCFKVAWWGAAVSPRCLTEWHVPWGKRASDEVCLMMQVHNVFKKLEGKWEALIWVRGSANWSSFLLMDYEATADGSAAQFPKRVRHHWWVVPTDQVACWGGHWPLA